MPKRILEQVLAEPLTEDELSAFTSLVGADCVVDDEGVMFASAQAVAWAIVDEMIAQGNGHVAWLISYQLKAAGYERPEETEDAYA